SGHLETALSQERSAEEYRVALVEAQLQSSRLSRLTRDILLLHQLQAPGGLSDERADLSDSVGTALAELGALLEARQLSVSGDFPQGIEVPGRQTYADAAVRNLIENAARYTTKGGCIQIQLAMGCFTIANDCVFPPDVNLESFFEPFGRSDPSRNSSSGGNGLGLAVCRAIANANGWSVSLARTDTGILAKIDFSR
ncbi:MAG: HAMP domain-containing sensor histidine kinase, partial [Fimbriimonadaceae bacterium]